MSRPISSDYETVIGGSQRAVQSLPVPTPVDHPSVPVHPRLTAAVDEADAHNREQLDRTREGAERTRDHTSGLRGVQEQGGRSVRSVTAAPPVPLSAMQPSPAPMLQPAYAPMPSLAPPAAAMAPAVPPSGISSISPQLLAALVLATQARAQTDAAAGIIPSVTGEVASQRSAVSPQPEQPLDVSQVSLAQYPGGQLTREQTAAVIDQALTINGVPNDPQLRAQWQQVYQHMAEGESARDPNAKNNWDTNATGSIMSDGAYANSSRGIWQCIPSTFATYHMGGTSTSIYDPVASAAASMNYVMDRYKVSPTGEGLASFAASRGVGRGTYTGY